jgi:hypothetical protein
MAKHDSTTDESPDLNSDSPTTLEDLIEEERTQLMSAFAVLGCTSVAIENDPSADRHAFYYAHVIELARKIIDETINRLDSVYLRTFYEELRKDHCNLDDEEIERIEQLEQELTHKATGEHSQSDDAPDKKADEVTLDIARAVELLRRIQDDLDGINAHVYTCMTALQAPSGGDDAGDDIAKVLESTYLKLFDHVHHDVRNALKALGQEARQ